MGAFPSHDVPELIYSTLVSRPTMDSQVEVCLVPLLPRFFNDGHKKVKKRLNDLLARKVAPAPGSSASPPAKRGEHAASTPVVEHIITGTEAFFFVNTKDAFLYKDEEQRERATSAADGAGHESAAGSPAAVPASPSPPAPPPRGPSHTTPSTIRPVPFAVCILDPDGPSEGGSGNAHGGRQHHSHGNNSASSNANIIILKGRRVQLVGFISCCMDRQVRHLNIAPAGRGHSANGGVGATASFAAGDGKRPIPVVLDIMFDDNASHAYLTESVVLLASLAFRKQFVNCCALYFHAGDGDVETVFDRYMERIQLRLSIRHNDYRGLRAFYSHYPLLDMIKDLRMQDSSTHFALYENHHGEYGLEATFSKTFLGRWMRYVEKMMRVDSVNGYHVRCSAADLLQERDRLLQERQDSGAFLEEEEEDECLFGGALVASAMKQWLLAGSQSLTQPPPPPPVASPMMVFPPGNYWQSQMPMVVGVPPAYGAGAPIALQQPCIMGQPPQFISLAGGAAPMYPSAPAYMPTAAGLQLVAQPGSFPVAAAPGGAPQQIVYFVQQGGQIALPAAAPQVFYSPKAPAFPAFSPYAAFPQPPAPQ